MCSAVPRIPKPFVFKHRNVAWRPKATQYGSNDEVLTTDGQL